MMEVPSENAGANQLKEVVREVLTLKNQLAMLVPKTRVKIEDTGTPRVKMEDDNDATTLSQRNIDPECIDLVSDDDYGDGEQEHVQLPHPLVTQNRTKYPTKSQYTKPPPTLRESNHEHESAEASPKRPRVKSSVQDHQKKLYSKPPPTLLQSDHEHESAEASPKRPRVKSSVQDHKKKRILRLSS
jgi:hypothetical protein